MFIHRDRGGDPEDGDPGERREGPQEVELIVAKQRNGPPGTIDLIFLSEFTRFESRARGDWQ